MSVREIVLSEIVKVADEQTSQLPPLSDGLSLVDLGLDSLGFAILVARLEDLLGLDPFTTADEARYPETLGDLVNFYEKASLELTSLREPMG
jgi:acyl carrier protein